MESTRRSTAKTATKAPTAATKLSTKATTATHKSSTTRELLAEASAAAHEAATTTAEARWSSEAVFSDLENATVPVVSVELLDSDLSIIRVVESDDTGTLHAAIRGDVNVSTDDSASVSYTKCQYIVHALWASLSRSPA